MIDFTSTLKNKATILLGILLICFLPFFYYQDTNFRKKYLIHFTVTNDEELRLNSSEYLVSTPRCKIPNIDPFLPEIKKYYHPEKYSPCRKLELLTYVTKTDNIATLHVDTEIVPSYTKNKVICCYSYITREKNKEHPDDHIKLSTCVDFNEKVTLRQDAVLVKCRDAKSKQQVYENTHFALTVSASVRQKLELSVNNTGANPFSVLLIGIDSISRLNFIRSLPSTHRFLEENDWISLKGYNKIGDNTFPNVMAILTGFNESTAYDTCNPKQLNRLDRCPLIWYDYSRLNYVTGYAEDQTDINTFNYKKKGFTKPPTDYYFRPYILGTEKLKKGWRYGTVYCTGPETSGERIMNLAREFAITFKEQPSFSFFWMNTFSHNDVSAPGGMDKKVRALLEDLSSGGVLENSIVFFLSDHGIRFGDIRYTPTGWLEERLPFIYISVPERLRSQFPEEFRNLVSQSDRLTTPYDLHMTLQHILVISGLNHTVRPSSACPGCRSLFARGERDRSCEEAAVEQHWCTCGDYIPLSRSNRTAMEAAQFVVAEIGGIVKGRRGDGKCAKFAVDRIIAARVSESFSYKEDVYLLIVVETRPMAVFEATVLYDGAKEVAFKLQGGISRLDAYGPHSKCVNDAYLKKYCYCR